MPLQKLSQENRLCYSAELSASLHHAPAGAVAPLCPDNVLEFDMKMTWKGTERAALILTAQMGRWKRGRGSCPLQSRRLLCNAAGCVSPACLPAFPKALQIATETNCITEYLQESETQLQKAKLTEKLGLLYGVPVSIKDSINCQVPPA